jgi:tetratricopeptide (TPR) repeat protein
MPTYMLNAPEKAPIFARDWSYQRAKRSVYPYVLNDNMTTVKDTVTYKALYLENDYVKLCVLPEIGGRLMYAVDKTNGYDIFYHNHVIKPANVGMTGAWISGGVEWNVFHHHRATSHSPIDYSIASNDNGSKTIWIGETELRHRMSWAIGITLYPDRSYIEVTGRLINSSPDDNSILYWSNISTAVNDDYQIIFPQSVKYGTFHCKNTFAHWPITHEAFNGIEGYKNNVDASWWKNHFMSNSIFAWDKQEDFLAGYDYGKHAGTMIVGNHNIVKGGKFWLWGPNSMWDTKILTDSDGHYCELMVGAYSDNQPDYSWIAPGEVKTFTHYCYGIRDIDGAKNANKDFAINLDFVNGKALVGVNASLAAKNMRVVVSNAGNSVYEKQINVAPDAPFVETVKLPKGYVETDVAMSLLDADGNEVLSYKPIVKDPNSPLPNIVERPKRPADIENTEELYLVGLRNLQFHNPFVNPTDYFNEVLRRDSNDTRANTKMGVWYRQHGDNEKAKEHLRRAIVRLTKDYTRPSDCEAMYNLGLILKEEGRVDAATDTLYRAVWNYTYNSPANFQLGQLYNTLGNTEMALDRLNEAINYNGRNFNAKNLKASILRVTGHVDEANRVVDEVLEMDPLNAYSMYEKFLLGKDNNFEALMRDAPESYLELAIQYFHNGFISTAEQLLQTIDKKVDYPTIKMWLGYLADNRGDKAAAADYFTKAVNMSVDYCNPFRLETVPVLEMAVKYAPNSYKPYYYLGNLWYDKNQDKAIDYWTKVTEIAPEFPMAWRNLGWAYWVGDKPDYAKSADFYRKAIDLAPEEALFLEEIDQVYEAKGEDVATRYNLLKSHHNTAVKRYYPLAGEVITGTFVGDYDYVLNLLHNCYFPTREGVANFHETYVDALLLAGYNRLNNGEIDKAIALYNEAFEYPENHQVFLVDTRAPRDAQIYYYLGDAYTAKGNKAKATENYKKAAMVNTGKTDNRYWQALALKKIGKADEANAIFSTLKQAGQDAFVTDYVNFYGAEGTTGKNVASINTKAYYTRALGELGLGDTVAAKADLQAAVALKPDFLWAVQMLKLLNK